jgi:hypothetical protein
MTDIKFRYKLKDRGFDYSTLQDIENGAIVRDA